jgi:hypothetical protein
MPRPKSPHPKVKIHIVLPQALLARVMLHIASPDHSNGFPQGALSAFIEAALTEKLERLRDQSPAKTLP